MRRFANPAIAHRLGQIAADGSHKLPQRLAGPFQARLAAGAVPHWLTLTLACWAQAVHAGAVADRRADDVRSRWDGPGNGRDRARRVLDLPGLLPEDVSEHPDVQASLAAWCEQIDRRGVRDTVTDAATLDRKASGWT